MSEGGPGSRRTLVLTPRGRDSALACAVLSEAGVASAVCPNLTELLSELTHGAALALIADEALRSADLGPLAEWIAAQPAWSDFPFVILTERGGGLERNPMAARLLATLGNVSFVERPFHPTTLVSMVKAALRGRLRQYEARERIEAIRVTEERFRTLAETIPQLAWMADADGAISWFNRRWYDYTGTTPDQMRTQGRQAIQHPDHAAGVTARYRAAVAAGEPWEDTFPLRGRDGEYRWFLSRAQPFHDNEGRITGWFGTNTDVTVQQQIEEVLEQRVQARTAELAAANRQLAAQISERERAETALRQAQRLEAVGQLTSGVAHDFNNLLTVVLGNVRLLERGATDPAVTRRLDLIGQAAERGARLTAQLLAFSRRQKLEPKVVDLNGTVAGMRDLLQSTLGGGIRVETRLEGDLWPAVIDPTQIELAILNLAINARDAMGPGGNLTVSTANVVLGAPGRAELPQAGEYIAVTVADNGSGMDEGVRAKVFEPFFTTKEVGKGSGLGLSQVFGLAKQSGGGVGIETAPGQGTSVIIYLPRAAPQVEIHPAPERSSTPPPREGATVLLVDDDDAVREITCGMLRDLGYRVVEAGSGGAALERLDSEPAIDLLLLDFAMPGMNGAEVAREIRVRRPDLPIVFATGYADTALMNETAEERVLQKPVAERDLAETLDEALRAGA